MGLVHVLRHQVLVEHRSVREVARANGLGRNTVRRYVRGAEPGRPQLQPRPSPLRDQAAVLIAELLEEAKAYTAKKQQLTAKKLHELLKTEKNFVVGYSLVKEVFAEHKRRKREVFVPLAWEPGEAALVDFFEVVIDVDEPQGALVVGDLRVSNPAHEGPQNRVKAFLFLMRLPFAGVDVVVLYPRQDQVCFLDGHVRAFRMLGGIPARVVYDNLKPAVQKHLVGSARLLQPRFSSLASHYAFEPCFARPYTGHDKGAVEARGKSFRVQGLVPIPRGETLVEVTHALQEQLIEKLQGRDDVSVELSALRELPEHDFDARKHDVTDITRRSLLQKEGAAYSVPEALAGTTVDVWTGAFAVDVQGRDGTHVTHPRARFGERRIDYRHYTKTLSEKPQAVRQVAHVLVPQLGEPFVSVWRELLAEHDPIDAARLFCRVLRLVNDVGALRAAAQLAEHKAAGRGLSAVLARAPPRPPPSSLLVPERLRVDVPASPLDVYDALLGGPL